MQKVSWLAGVRAWWLPPRHLLRPGSYSDRQITRLDVPTPAGPVPALHIVPAGGTQAVVCYAHGSGSDKYFYTWEIADTLVSRGLAALIIDLDGHGESPRPQAFPGTLRSFAGVIGWLHEHYTRVGVIGASLGGSIAARTLAEGTPIDALALLASPCWLRLSRWTKVLEGWRLLRPAVLRQLRRANPYHLVRAWTDTPRARTRIGTADLIARLDLPGSLRRIGQGEGDTAQTPLLLAYAGRDTIVAPEQAAAVRAAMPAGAAFHMFSHSSHLSLMIDPQVHRLVGGWLAERLATPNSQGLFG